MTKISSFQRRIFQEACQITGLSVLDLQFLVAPVIPVFELRVDDLERMWKSRRVKIRWIAEGSKEDGQAVISEKRLSNNLNVGAGGTTRTSIGPYNKVDYVSKAPSLLAPKVKERKRKLEERAREYGRFSIDQPWHDTENKAVSTYRCSQLVKGRSKYSIQQKANVTVRIIELMNQSSVKFKVLVLMESQSKFLFLFPYKRLGAVTILSRIDMFLSLLREFEIHRNVIRWIDDSRNKKCLREVVAHYKKFKKKGISVEVERLHDYVDVTDQLFCNIEEGQLENCIASILTTYNIGRYKRRTRPFIAFKENFQKTGQPVKDMELERWITSLLKDM